MYTHQYTWKTLEYKFTHLLPEKQMHMNEYTYNIYMDTTLNFLVLIKIETYRTNTMKLV